MPTKILSRCQRSPLDLGPVKSCGITNSKIPRQEEVLTFWQREQPTLPRPAAQGPQNLNISGSRNLNDCSAYTPSTLVDLAFLKLSLLVFGFSNCQVGGMPCGKVCWRTAMSTYTCGQNAVARRLRTEFGPRRQPSVAALRAFAGLFLKRTGSLGTISWIAPTSPERVLKSHMPHGPLSSKNKTPFLLLSRALNKHSVKNTMQP